jgi:hypothetical protein
MPEYEVKLLLNLKADNKIEVADIISAMLEDWGDIQYSAEVDNDLFEELGVRYD